MVSSAMVSGFLLSVLSGVSGAEGPAGVVQPTGHRALDDLVPQLDTDPADHSWVDDDLDGDLAPGLTAQCVGEAIDLVATDRVGHPDGRDRPVALGGSEIDVGVDGVAEGAFPCRHSPGRQAYG